MNHDIIRLENGTPMNPVSAQLLRYGISLDDSCSRSGNTTVWETFCQQACEYYRIASVHEYKDRSQVCGLCGHSDLCSVYTVVSTDDLYTVVRTKDGCRTVLWPSRIMMGSTCVQKAGIESSVTKFHNSTFMDGVRCSYSTNQDGLVYVSDLLGSWREWRYYSIRIPHSIYTVIPHKIMEAYKLEATTLTEPFMPGSRKTMYALLNARDYGWTVSGRQLETMPLDARSRYFTVITRSIAQQIMNERKK